MEIIVVGISSQEEESAELLSWAINVPARPDDTVVALHVLVRKDDKKFDSMEFVRAKIDKANAFTIDLLGAFTDLCQAKQVKVVSKVVLHSSVQKGLIDEVVSLDASFLILGASMYQVRRPTLGVTKYCFQHAPAGCSVITVKGRRVSPRTESFQKALRIDSDSSHEGIHKLELKRRHKEYVGKKLSSLQKRFLSRISFGHGEVTESFHMSKEKLSSKEILQEQISPIEQHIRKNRNIDNDEDADDDAVSSSNSFSKIGIHGETLSDCDLESVSGLNQQNCLSIWRNFNLEFLPNNCLKLLTSSLGRRSVQAAAKYGENAYVPPDANGGGIMAPPILKPSWRCFTFEEIAVATNNFHPDNMVGRGGYAEVYRGNLQDGQIIAVKRLASGSPDEQKEKDFLTELGIIGHVCHPNTASLIGCCIENGLHLIFDFSPHGSLASVLHGTKTQLLEWPVRYKVAVGTARGLHYLHKCCQRRIIHRDIKASNVLLGPDFEPQISDFGLAKWLPRQWTHHSVTPIEGTFGYLAPEYFLHGIVDEKTDVFAFGVLLLEIISGRRPVDASKQNLLLWAKPLLESANIAELADPKLGGQYDVRQMQRMVLTASLCIRQSAIWRPSMSEVLQLLTDGETPEIAECWRMSTYKTDEVDDYWDFDGQESSQRCRIRSLYY